jgi:hypothetical protein
VPYVDDDGGPIENVYDPDAGLGPPDASVPDADMRPCLKVDPYLHVCLEFKSCLSDIDFGSGLDICLSLEVHDTNAAPIDSAVDELREASLDKVEHKLPADVVRRLRGDR